MSTTSQSRRRHRTQRRIKAQTSWSAEKIREQLQRAYIALNRTMTPSPWAEIETTEE